MDEAEDDDQLRHVFDMDETLSLLLETGFRKAVSLLTLSDKGLLRSTLLDYHCMVKVKAEMDQFAQGLDVLGAHQLIKKFCVLSKPYFVHDG